ncbi:MAG: hypothetical protein NXI31_21200 [bacterium]|nr:hypothetical protein [bacterium]
MSRTRRSGTGQRIGAGAAIALVALLTVAGFERRPATDSVHVHATQTPQSAPQDSGTPPSVPPTGTSEQRPAPARVSLHRAWLTEVLDLDPDRAAELYAEVLDDRRPRNLQRWVAAARLVELQRIDAAPRVRIDPADAPALLRQPFQDADATLEIRALLDQLTGDPVEVMALLSESQMQIPELRPLVGAAESWFADQALPSRLDRIRQRRTMESSRPRFTDRIYAAMVFYAEVDGRGQRAEGLRRLYFASWQPPAAPADTTKALRRIRENLATLLTERESTGQWRRWHELFRDRFEQVAAEDPAGAVALIRRVPQYAERLLAPTATENR